MIIQRISLKLGDAVEILASLPPADLLRAYEGNAAGFPIENADLLFIDAESNRFRPDSRYAPTGAIAYAAALVAYRS